MISAILQTSRNLKGCTIYTTEFPCNECAKFIVQSGIKSIFFKNQNDFGDVKKASKRIFDAAKVEPRYEFVRNEMYAVQKSPFLVFSTMILCTYFLQTIHAKKENHYV